MLYFFSLVCFFPGIIFAALKEYKLIIENAGSIRYLCEGEFLMHVDRLSATNQILYRHSYVYDSEGVLIKEKMIGDLGEIIYEKPGVIHSPYHKEVCEYDSADHLIKHIQDNIIREYTYSESGELVVNPIHYKACIYDDHGNLIQNKDTSYVYDEKNRLVRVISSEGDVSYFYNDEGKRVGRSCDGVIEIYGHVGSNEILVFNELGSIKELRIPGLSYHKDLIRPIAIETDHAVYAPIHDLQNNIIKLVDIKTKEVIALNLPEPFGENLSKESPTRWIFSGKSYDPKTGLVYFGHRFYCPELHQWLSQDPVRQTLNLYEYCFNNPLSFIDPDGRASEKAREHYSNALEALGEAIFHSGCAGAAVDMPPVAVYEIYQASKKWIEAAKEFNAGCREDEKETEIDAKQTEYKVELE